jgi:integrase/recombinase XerD
MLSKWMGHSIMEITAIYANAVGEEQQAIAARMWS